MTNFSTFHRFSACATLFALAILCGTSTFAASGPDVSVSLTDGVTNAYPGGTYYFTATVTNIGNQTASSIALTQQLPSTVTVVKVLNGGTANKSGLVTWPSFSLSANASALYQVQVQVINPLPAGTALTLSSTATATVAGDVNTANNSSTYTNAIIAAPVLAVDLTDGLTSVSASPNTTMHYTVEAGDVGTIGSTGDVVTVTIPSSTFIVAGSISNGGSAHSSGTGTQITWPAFPLPVGTAVQRSFELQLVNPLPTGTSAIEVTASIDDDHANGPNGDPSRASTFDYDTVVGVTPSQANLNISITDGLFTINPGATAEYTVELDNVTTLAATGVTATATIPPNTMVVSGSITNGGSVQGGSVVWPAFSIPGQQSQFLQFTLQLAGTLPNPAPTNLSVTATVAGNFSTGSNTVTDTDVIVIPATTLDLSISQCDGLTTCATPGTEVCYTLTICDISTTSATGVIVTDVIPIGSDYVSSSDGGVYNPSTRTITWPAFSLSGGVSVFRSFMVQVENPPPAGTTSLVNTANVTDDGTHGPDKCLCNNTTTLTNPICSQPNLQITAGDPAPCCTPGSNVTYTLMAGNLTDVTSTGVLITDTIPAFTTFVSASNGATFANGVVSFPVFSLPGNSTAVRTVTILVNSTLPAGVTVFSNVSRVTDDQTHGTDSNTINNTFNTVVAVCGFNPDLAITKTVPVPCVSLGADLTYTLTASTQNATAVTGVVVTDTLPANTTFVSASDGGTFANGVVTFPAFSMNGNSSVNRTITVAVAATVPAGTTSIVNVASVQDDGSHGPDINQSNNTFTLTTPICSQTDLAITGGDPAPCTIPGSNLTYTLMASNLTDVTSTGVLITDTIPAFSSFVSASNGGTFANGVVTFPVFTLPGNSTAIRTVTILIDATLPAGVTTFTNTSRVSDDGTHGADTNQVNNSFNNVVAVCGFNPDLAITKTVPVPCVSLGADLTYTLTASTLNANAVTGVVITDTLPANTTFVSASNGGTFANGVVTFPAIAMNGNSSVTRTVTVAVAASVPAGTTSIVNVASVQDDGTHGPDIVPTNNTFTLTTPICGTTPDLAVEINSNYVCNNQVDTFTYTLMVSNVNEGALTGVVLTDTIPPNSTFVSASNGGTLSGGVVTFPTFNLAADATALRTIVVTVALPLLAPTVPINVTDSASVHDDGTNGADTNPSNNTATVVTQVSNLHFVSDPTGEPNPIVVGIPEVFAAVAIDNANPNAPITYTWNFGDGSAGTGANTTHTYSSPGPYTITLTVSNGIGCPIGFTLNRDTTGTNPAVTCKLLRAPFNLTKPDADSLDLVAQLTLPKGYNPAGHTVTVTLASFQLTATLNAQGKGVGLPKNQVVQLRPNGALSILTVKVTKSNLRALLAPGVAASTRSATVPNQVFSIAFDLNSPNASTFGSAITINYVSNGKTGAIGF